MHNRSKREEEELQAKLRADALDYIDKLLEAEKVTSTTSSFFSITDVADLVGDDGLDPRQAEAICILGDNGCLKKMSFDIAVAAPSEAVNTAKAIVSGIENLRKLEQYGMNNKENNAEVILAGEKATEKSLELWEKRKGVLEKAARSSEHSSLYSNPAARAAARKMVNEKLSKVDETLNRPAKLKAPSLLRSSSKGG